ncbi:hypothetical protein GOM49_05430 [Clostridium bovifaecis]|uniref:Lipoprotein n=1 Tax=Clostridium bovifaecis TaxID=2184719 RepID=A0A6I6EUR1_9CLOT|nr:hypothetical protein GOM49_05430 [Clostridium bovifaecis]
MKIKPILLALAIVSTLFAGCGQRNNQNTAPKTGTETKTETKTENGKNEITDGTTTASIVDNEAAFEKAISKTGTWIIATLNDITTNKELSLDGEFKNGKKDKEGKDVIQRKIALYTQDENRNVTARFTLTAPKLTINSPEASIQHGTFKGDLYVSSKNFKLVDATVDGNVYFTNEEAKSTFQIDNKSKITGKQELKK